MYKRQGTANPNVATGVLSVAGGTIKAVTLTLGNNQGTNGLSGASATFTMNSGATLAAGTVKIGATSGTVTSTFNWNDGTIKNYDASTDLTLGAGLTLTMAAAGTHAFDIGAGRTGTVNANLAEAAAGAALTKLGAGTLVLAGVNGHTGATSVSAGTLSVTGSLNVAGASGVTIASGATFAVSGTLHLTSASASILNDGTLQIQAGVLDLGGLFDSYSGQYTLVSGAGATGGTFASIVGYSGALPVSYNAGVLTFGAVPEPSAYALLGSGALAAFAAVRRRRR